jgi:hypothetical protein
LETTLITLRGRNKGSEIFGVSVVNARAVATKTAAVVVALKNGGAQYGAPSILLFLVEQLVKFADACTKDDQKSALWSSSREVYHRYSVPPNNRSHSK